MSTKVPYAGGATSKEVTLDARSGSLGVPYTAGVFNTAGLVAEYRRAGANAAVAITLVTQTVGGAYTSGGFVHISGGRYRLDLPNAAIAAGADYVTVWLYGVADTLWTTAQVDIRGVDPRSATVALATGAITTATFAAGAINAAAIASAALVSAKFSAADPVPANVEQINATTVLGTGIVSDKWRGA